MEKTSFTARRVLLAIPSFFLEKTNSALRSLSTKSKRGRGEDGNEKARWQEKRIFDQRLVMLCID